MAKKTSPPGPQEDILAGITEKSTKAELLSKLREAARRLAGREDDRIARMQELEERVRAKFAGNTPDLRSVTIMGTPEEYTEMVDFLENFEDIMPVAMHRILAGAKSVTENNVDADV